MRKNSSRIAGKIARALFGKNEWVNLIPDSPPLKWYKKIWNAINGYWFLFRWNILRYRPEINKWKKECSESDD